jgi:hypothetical protein
MTRSRANILGNAELAELLAAQSENETGILVRAYRRADRIINFMSILELKRLGPRRAASIVLPKVQVCGSIVFTNAIPPVNRAFARRMPDCLAGRRKRDIAIRSAPLCEASYSLDQGPRIRTAGGPVCNPERRSPFLQCCGRALSKLHSRSPDTSPQRLCPCSQCGHILRGVRKRARGKPACARRNGGG